MSDIMELTFRRRAPVPFARPRHTMMRHNHKMTSKGESELSLTPNRAK